jgi:hypothetical protein
MAMCIASSGKTAWNYPGRSLRRNSRRAGVRVPDRRRNVLRHEARRAPGTRRRLGVGHRLVQLPRAGGRRREPGVLDRADDRRNCRDELDHRRRRGAVHAVSGDGPCRARV